jgi:hypothetical protein
MCLIVDACWRDKVLTTDPLASGRYLLNALLARDSPLRLVVGGRLLCEHSESPTARRIINSLLKAGRARLVKAELVDGETVKLRESGHLKSNDGHVIALAIVSGARAVATDDVNLMKDVKNKNIVYSPRGWIFSAPAHLAKLRRACLQSCTKRNRKPRR